MRPVHSVSSVPGAWRMGVAMLLVAAGGMASHAAEAPPLRPRLELHVAADGADDNPGTESQPFATLEKARDTLRAIKQSDGLPDGGAAILIHPGTYAVREIFQLTAADSGTAAAPIVYRAATPEPPRFTGGVRLHAFRPIDDPAVLERLPEEARDHIVAADLAAAGIHAPIPFERGGFASGRGFHTHPAMELFVDGEPMVLARWPNEGFVEMGEVTGPLTLKGWDNKPGSPEGRFKFESPRLERWMDEPDGWLYGYWYWNWADSYEKIERIDRETGEIVLAEPWHRYGYKPGNRFYAVNMLSELDAPGEWYLDRARGAVYLYPTHDLSQAVVELSAMPVPFVETDGASHLRFEGLLWECGAADGIVIRGGKDVRLEGCTIRKLAGTGVVVQGGSGHAVQSCDIHTLGRGGVAMAGGDRKTLTPGEHLVENCHIHDLSRIDHTYTPGVWLDGVGNRIRHNLFHDIASSALRVEGNDHLIELNEAYRVVLESDDQGAVDMYGNPTYRGNVYRHNYWHHLGSPGGHSDGDRPMQAGIRLDDAICGVLIQGNVFHRCGEAPTHFGGVQIHGGKENLVEGNLFVDCGAAVSFSPWGEARWLAFIESALDAPAIDKALYLARYPALAQLAEGHDVNTVRGNVVVRCDDTFLRAPEGLQATGNRIEPGGTAFQEGPDGRLIWSEDEAKQYGLEAIPFDTIGLYEDAWRAREGHTWPLRSSTP